MIEEQIPLLEEILGKWQETIGQDYTAYKNHVYRVVHFCAALSPGGEQEWEKIIIAGCFHDLGIWTENTLDYLPPSLVLVEEYLERRNLGAWAVEIGRMIDMHHKIRKYEDSDYPLVEAFRRADLVDLSLGFVTCGLPGNHINDVRKRFPNSGFHKRLTQLAAGWFFRHPFHPAPFVKW